QSRSRDPTLFPYTTLFRSQSIVRCHIETLKPLHIMVERDTRNHHALRSTGRPRGEHYIGEFVPAASPLKERSIRQCRQINMLGRSEEHTSELQSRENLVCR